MKNSKLLAKSITLGLILAMPYSVVNADDIKTDGPWLVNDTLTGYGNIIINGWSEISGKLGDDNNKEFGAENFTTGTLSLKPNGVIYVSELVETTSKSGNSAISGKIYANDIEFNNARVSFNNSAEIIAKNSLTITTSETITNNSNIVAKTITMNNYLINSGSITANEKLTTNNFTIDNRGNISGSSIIVTGNGELKNSGTININGELKTYSGRIYNSKDLTAGSIKTNGQVRNDVNGKITITDTINANSLHNSGSVSGNELITLEGVTNGGFSAGSYTNASLEFNSIDTRSIINTGEIKAQTIDNGLNIANMGK